MGWLVSFSIYYSTVLLLREGGKGYICMYVIIRI